MDAIRDFPGDDFDTWVQGSTILGCRSQWITPESVHEQLPYWNEEYGVAIIADAIIDNRYELFERLNVKRDRRLSMTDSELIVLAYVKWGQETPKYLIGDFAFVIWDRRSHTLFGARDLVGSRTLYYTHNIERFAFCSVIQPMFSLSNLPKRLCEERFAEFLAIPTLLDAVNVHTTFYQDIKQIPPAHSFTLYEGKLSFTQYGSLVTDTKDISYRSDGEYIEAFQEIYQEAIRSRLRTYKQVGVTLSGGLDSGSVAGFAAGMLQQEGKCLQAYSSVPSRDFVDWTSRNIFADETPYIQSVVDYVGNIKANYLDFPGMSPLSEIDDWLDILHAPYKNLENSFWVKSIQQQAAQQGIGVLLTGVRGNFSVSWGSAVGYYALLLKRLSWIRLYQGISDHGKQLRIGRKRIIHAVRQQAFPEKVTSQFQPIVPSLIHPEFAAQSGIYKKLEHYDVGLRESPVQIMNERQSFFGNLSILNMQSTISAQLSYRYGIWERDPTSDSRVVKFCLGVPFSQYVHNGFGRSLIRRSTENVLPDKVRLNQRTRGAQGMDWVHRIAPNWNAVQEEIRLSYSDELTSSYLNMDQVKSSLDRVGSTIKPEQAEDPHVQYLMRSLIAHRFLQRLK